MDSLNNSEEKEYICPKCNNARTIREKDGSIHVCYDCLAEGRLDVHSKNIKDSGVRV